MPKDSIYLPCFQKYVNHLDMFTGLFALRAILEIIEFNESEEKMNPYIEEQIDMWESITLGSPTTHRDSAEKELEQILSLGNTMGIINLTEVVSREYDRITKKLSKDALQGIVDTYNLKPQTKFIKKEIDEEQWIGTMQKVIFPKNYVDTYIENVVDTHLLPDFEELCLRIPKLLDFTKNVKEKYKHGAQSFDGQILNEDKLDQVMEMLCDKKYMSLEDEKYCWLGIGRSKTGSLAALAVYLEESLIMKRFDIMTEAFRAYKKEFSLNATDQTEWNLKYNSSDGIQFSVPATTKFIDELGFILKI